MGIFLNFAGISPLEKRILLCAGTVFLLMLVFYIVKASLEIRAFIQDIQELHWD